MSGTGDRQMGEAGSEPIGTFYTWWQGDALPLLARDDGFAAGRAPEPELCTEICRVTSKEIRSRVAEGHTPYLASLGGVPVACGWAATRRAAIPAVDVLLDLPPGTIYLWDFTTAPRARGRGVYRRLLQAIVQQELQLATRFWIGHDRGNEPSARGIRAAGFSLVGDVYALAGGRRGLLARGPAERVEAACGLLGMSPIAAPPARGGDCPA